MIWKYINTGYKNGAFNMAYDENLVHKFNSFNQKPILRIYGWNPHAISVGFNQGIDHFDLKKLNDNGIDIVRRPTGGRAILHAHELTYSVIIKLNDDGPRAIYTFINKGLLRGLQLLGIRAELSSDDTDFRKHYQTNQAVACFSTSTKSEIKYRGKKLIGSAQRKYGNVILQHGSFLLGSDHRDIVKYLSHNIIEFQRIIEETLSLKTIEAETILRRHISLEEAADAIKHGFELEYKIEFEDIEDNDFIEETSKSSVNV